MDRESDCLGRAVKRPSWKSSDASSCEATPGHACAGSVEPKLLARYKNPCPQVCSMVATVSQARTLIRILVSSAYLCALPSFVALAATEAGKSAPSSGKTQQPDKTSKPDSAPKKQASENVVWNWDKPYTPSKEILELRKKATAGDQRAQAEMALRYRMAEGIPQDFDESLRLCESNPHPIAQYVLSVILHSHRGIQADQERADDIRRKNLEPLKVLSEQGDSLATAILGVLCQKGLWTGLPDVPEDLFEAEKFYRKSHDSGCDFGTTWLGNLLLSEPQGKRIKEGRNLLREAGRRGSAFALKVLMIGFFDGFTFRIEDPTDDLVSDLNMLASLGNLTALKTLYGVCHSFNNSPKKYQNETRAFKILSVLNDRNALPRDRLDHLLAQHYLMGWGVSKNYNLGFNLAHKSALMGYVWSFDLLRWSYQEGRGVPKSSLHAYAWALLAAAENQPENSKEILGSFEQFLSPVQIAEAQKLAHFLDGEIKSKKIQVSSSDNSSGPVQSKTTTSGTGFFLSDNGYIATNFHVVSGAKKISVRTANGEMGAVIVLADQINDLAVIKAPVLGKPLPFGDVSFVAAGAPVYTVGFPNPTVQGFEPKLTKGDINSATGLKDDPRMFQISVPVQPGNSGGPLLNERGAVVGIITSQLNSLNALITSGALPQNVNYALKVNYLKPLIESNKELREAVDGSKSREKEVNPPESAMESVLLIFVEK
jgi:S1-C subfamily serine protease